MMQAGDRELVAQSLRQIFTATATAPARLRDDIESFGWLELLREEPGVAVPVLFALQGEHLPATTMLDQVALAGLGLGADESVTTGFVFPPAGSHEPPEACTDGGGLTLPAGGLVVAGTAAPERVTAVARLDGEVILATGTPASGTWPARGTGLDCDSGWASLDRGLTLDGQTLRLDAAGEAPWAAALAQCHRALACELTAVSRAMLELAVVHVRERRQFGQPLGSFQAVQHKLADVRVWLEVADLSTEAAWEDSGECSAALAKIHACRAARTAAQNCQQVLGGMGFTWEHSFHRYLRRAWTLEPLLGAADTLRAEIGAALRESGRLPLLAQL
jgi:hypothetical protein